MKRGREEELVRIEIEYWGKRQEKMVYDKNERLLSIVVGVGRTINIDMLPKDVPHKDLFQYLFSKLPSNWGTTFPPGTILKSSVAINESNDVLYFVNSKTWEVFINGEKGSIDDLMQPTIFVEIILPILSYKDVLALEQFNQNVREIIADNNIWKILFKRDFPEIYHPDIFSDEILAQVPKPDYLTLLDSMSKILGYTTPYWYWKLLYQYQLINNFDGFKYQHDSEDNTMLTHCVAFGKRDCLMLRGGNLEFQLIGGHTIDPNPNPDPNPNIIKEIPNTQLYQAVEDIASRGWNDVEEFEKNDSYIFMVVSSLEKTLSCISDINGNIINQSNLDDKYDAGLIGDDFCYFNNTIMSKKYGLKHEIDPQLCIYTCYNTRSDCFLLMKREYFTKQIQLCKITRDGHMPLATFDKIKTYDFKFGTYTFNEHWLVYCTRNRSKIKILSARDGSVQKIILSFPGSRIKEMCIVGDYLHYFSSVEALHIIYNLKTGKKNEYSTDNIAFDYVRMSFMGPILCTAGPPGMLWADPNKLKLLGGSCMQCGSPSPKYACGNRCGAQYCDTQCQTRDWGNNHSLICARGGGGGRRQRKIHKVMTEFKEGRLKTSAGKTVTDRKQALAIALSEANELK